MPPEPPSDSGDNCLPCDGEIIIAISSDDSDEDIGPDHLDYTLLSQQEVVDGSSSDQNDDEEDNYKEERPIADFDNAEIPSGEAHFGSLPPAPRPSGSEEIASVWNSTPVTTNLPLNAEKAAQIQAAMANFTLPPSAVPAWAVNIPEEQWKQGLLEQLKRGNVRHFKIGAASNNNTSN